MGFLRQSGCRFDGVQRQSAICLNGFSISCLILSDHPLKALPVKCANSSARKSSLLRLKSIGCQVFGTPGVFSAYGVGVAASVTHQDQEGSCYLKSRVRFQLCTSRYSIVVELPQRDTRPKGPQRRNGEADWECIGVGKHRGRPTLLTEPTHLSKQSGPSTYSALTSSNIVDHSRKDTDGCTLSSFYFRRRGRN
jgi:hypothetical protein